MTRWNDTSPVHIEKPGYSSSAYCGVTRRNGVRFALNHRPATCAACIKLEPLMKAEATLKGAVIDADYMLDERRDDLRELFNRALDAVLAEAATMESPVGTPRELAANRAAHSAMVGAVTTGEFAGKLLRAIYAARALHAAKQAVVTGVAGEAR